MMSLCFVTQLSGNASPSISWTPVRSLEYNSLKHGMRPSVGGFRGGRARAFARSRTPEMTPVGGSDYGSTFWLGAKRRLDGRRHTFELSSNVTMGWAPQKFVVALPLISMSIRNVASCPSACRTESRCRHQSWPGDMDQFDAPWQHAPSISSMAFEHRTELPGWTEPDGDDILRTTHGMGLLAPWSSSQWSG